MAITPDFYVLDAFSLIFQVFHAIPEMTGPAGQPTQAVFGIFRDLLNLYRERKPDYLAAAFDGPGPVFRSEIYAEYKANRKEMPDDLVPQIPVIRRVFEGFRVPVLIEPGMEADDVIATLARRAEERGLDVFIVTADKDARQLISDQVRILNLRKNKFIDAAALEKEWGIRPDQVVDFLALTGDSVDNVPGVPGIGEGFAATFLKEFGTLDELLANVESRQGPQEAAEPARACRDGPAGPQALVAPARRPAARSRLGRLEDPAPDVEALKALCTECGFHRLPRRARRPRRSRSRSRKRWEADYHTVDTPESFSSVLERAQAPAQVLHRYRDDRHRPAAGRPGGTRRSAGRPARPITCRCAGRPGRRLLDRDRDARGAAADPARPGRRESRPEHQVRHAGPRRAGVELAGPITDTMILSYLLESGERNHNLDQLSQRLLDHTMIPITDLIGKGKNQGRMDQVEVDRSPSTPARTPTPPGGSRRSWPPRCAPRGSGTCMPSWSGRLIAVLARMEAAGVKVDVERLQQLSREFAERMDAIETEIYALAGRTVQHQLGPAAPPGALRGAQAAVARRRRPGRAEHGAGGPGGAGAQAPAARPC